MTQTFTIADPGTFEGTPYEVAARAVNQSKAVLAVGAESLARTEILLRNAELSRNLAFSPDDARADEWESSAQARSLGTVRDSLGKINKQLSVLALAAAYDPKI